MSRKFDIKFGTETFKAWYVDKTATARLALQALKPDVLLGLDCETMALPKYHHVSQAALSPHLSSIRLIQIFDGKLSIIIDLLKCKGELLESEIRHLLETRRFIAHNAVFDLAFLKRQFRPRSIDCGCTFIAFKLLAHAARPTDDGLRAGLDAVTKGLCGVEVLKSNQASDWSVPKLTFEQIEYSALDPVCVLKIAEKMAPALEKYKLYDFYNLLKAAQHPIVEMHLNGIGFNSKEHIELVSGWREKLYAAKKILLQQTGLDDITGPKVAKWLETNLEKRILDDWPRTDNGALKTDAITFSDFGAVSPAVKPFGAFQKYKVLTSDFGGKLLQQLNEETGRLHPQYHICGTRTGRLSCSKPNLQQSPRDKDFRSQFVPSKGMVFVGADYSAIEMRVAAEVSRDPAMLKAFKDGLDLHMMLGSEIAGIDIETLPKEKCDRYRQMGKVGNFACIYGAGAKTLASQARKAMDDTSITETQTGEIRDAHRRRWAGYRAWHVKLYEKCMETLRVRTVCGKLRRLAPEFCYGAAPNTIIQGSSAGCMLQSMVLFQQMIDKGLKAKLIATIHDELIAECLPQDANEVKETLEYAMVEGFKRVFPNGCTKNLVEAKIGNNWMELK